MYILGAKSVMSIVFHDLAPVVKIHKKLGKWGSLAIVLHPLLITYSYGEGVFYSVLPHISTKFERHVTLGRISLWLIIFTVILSLYFRKKLGFRTWKYIHYLAYISLPFALLHVPDIGSQYMKLTVVKGYYIGLVGLFFVFTVLRIRGLFNLDKHRYTVVSNQKLTANDYLLRLKPDAIAIAPKRGQYIYLKLGYISEDHPFSVTRYNESNGELFLIYRTFGMFTHVAAQLQPDKKVFIGGPYGSFTHEIDTISSPVVYIAGGIGITPFIDRILQESSQREQWLFVANRSADTAVFVATLKPYLRERCVEIYEHNDTPAKHSERGHLTPEVIQKYLVTPDNYHYFICGPPPMMKAVVTMLEKMGIDQSQIHIERFGW